MQQYGAQQRTGRHTLVEGNTSTYSTSSDVGAHFYVDNETSWVSCTQGTQLQWQAMDVALDEWGKRYTSAPIANGRVQGSC